MKRDRFDDYDPTIRNEKIEELLRDIGRKIKSSMPEGYGFCLQIFSYEGPEFFYLSSAQRKEMVKVLEEFCADQRRRSA